MSGESKSESYLYLAPALALLGAVTVFPLFFVLWLSMRREFVVFGISEFIGGRNFSFLLTDARYWQALKNTAYFSAASVVCELCLGALLAWLLHQWKTARGILLSVVLVPWVIPSVVSARLWEWIFNPDYGILNFLLGRSINWLGSPMLALNAAVAVDVWKMTPFVALLLLAAAQDVPRELFQAAAVDGAGRWRMFIHVLLPLMIPATSLIVLLRLLDTVRAFDVIYVLTGGGPGGMTETLSLYAYRLLFQTMEFGYGSAIAVSVFMFSVIITFFYLRLSADVQQ